MSSGTEKKDNDKTPSSVSVFCSVSEIVEPCAMKITAFSHMQ